jgi:hypothetical protein
MFYSPTEDAAGLTAIQNLFVLNPKLAVLPPFSKEANDSITSSP